MAYYNVCPRCSATLDPGEKCDCESERENRLGFFDRKVRLNRRTGQYSMIFDGKEALYATEAAE